MNPGQLARENDVLKEYIHINEILTELELEKRRVISVLNHYQLPNFEFEWNEKNNDTIENLIKHKKQHSEIIASFL